MKRRILSFALALCMALSLLPLSALAEDARLPDAADTPAQGPAAHWYYDQLNDSAKKLYNALDELSDMGEFTAGTASINLIDEKYFTNEDIGAYARGDSALAKAFLDARDAFFMDNPEFFYIDTTKLTLRVGQISNGYLAYINNGPNVSYLDSHFESQEAVKTAIAGVATKKDEIVKEIEQAKNYVTVSNASQDQDQGALSTAEIITRVHNMLVERFDYKYPSESEKQVTGVYSLVGGDANCQGYSKTMKWILDELGIPCVLVAGAAENTQKVIESHMWNYVIADGAWYAVDVTWDDPITASKAVDNLRYTYLLQGNNLMSGNHAPSGLLSPGGRTFSYPVLSDVSYDASISADLNDTSSLLKVYTVRMNDGSKDYTKYMLTYNNMSLNELEENGLHLAARFAYLNSKTNELDPFQPWVDMSAYQSGKVSSGDNSASNEATNYITFGLSRAGSIQFCITNKKMGSEGGKSRLCYEEDLSLDKNHEDGTLTKAMKIPYYSDYVTPPYVRTASPALTQCIRPVKTHYTIEYDQELKLVNKETPVGMKITATSYLGGALDNTINASVENLSISYGTYTTPDGNTHDSTILAFDFIPDKAYQGESVYYTLTPTNLISAVSEKGPNGFHISTSMEMRRPCPILAARGGDNEAFTIAYPTLVTNEKMNIFKYNGSDKVSAMDIRLVATIPSKSEEESFATITPGMSSGMSSVYDLTLGCKQLLAALRPGSGLYNVTIGLPYPAGYNYKENNDVIFKAYHYIKEGDGYRAVEIPCRITELGLEVIADGFSPFSLVAVPKGKGEATTTLDYKLVSVSLLTGGGDVTVTDGPVTVSAAGLYALSKDTEDGKSASLTFEVIPDEGYEIDFVKLNGKRIDKSAVGSEEDTAAQDTVTVTLNYDEDEVKDDNTLQVSFIAKTVKEAEKEITVVAPKFELVSLEKVDVSLTAGQGNVMLSIPNTRGGDSYYYKTTLDTDASNKPSVGDTPDGKWTKFTKKTEIQSDPGTELFVQVAKVGSDGITAWGQASATALASLESLVPEVTLGNDTITLASPISTEYTYYYKDSATGGSAPTLNSVVDAGTWTKLESGKNAGITRGSNAHYIQLMKSKDGKITGWGQTYVEPKDASVPDELAPTLTAGNGKVTLAGMSATGYTFYYKFSASEGSKPDAGSALTDEWTAMGMGAIDIPGVNGTPIFVQIVRVKDGKIEAWGQASATPKAPAPSGNSTSSAEDNTSAGNSASVSGGEAKIGLTAQVSGSAASVEVKEKDITDAIAKLEKAGVKTGGAITLQVTASNAKTLSATLPVATQNALVSAGVDSLTVENGLCSITLDAKALQAVKDRADAAVTLKIAPAEVKDEALSGRPAYELTATAGAITISDFGAGTVALSIPYKAAADEDSNRLCGVYVDAAGELRWIALSRYDAKAGEVKLLTNHFSTYAVGLRSDLVFSDTAEHWAEDSIAFVSARGLLTGTENGVFSPAVNVNRGMFVTVLGRLYGADVSGYTESSFQDVADGSYYAPYVAWAVAHGVAKGVGEGRFDPDRAISRQEMAVMMNGFTKAMGSALPVQSGSTTFTDSADIGDWATDAVGALSASGLMTGKEDGRFDPIGTATRAEAAVLLRRYIELTVG